MGYGELPSHQRMGRKAIGGTIAEGKFEELFNWSPWIRTGFDKPDWSDGKKVGWVLPKQLTAMPDYLIKDPLAWVECVGCKGNKVRSIKVEKVERLLWWQANFGLPVYFFIWNSSKKEYKLVPLSEINRDTKVRKFDDGVRYYDLNWADL